MGEHISTISLEIRQKIKICIALPVIGYSHNMSQRCKLNDFLLWD